MNKASADNIIIEGIHYATEKPLRIVIADDFIKSVSEIPETKDKNLYIAPGLIDNQVNGYAGVDFSGNDLSAQEIKAAVQALWKEGVTTFFPTLLTNSHENLKRNFRILGEASEHESVIADSIGGFHLEGPYISPEEGFRGCHPAQHIRYPSWEEFIIYQNASGGLIKQITLAPEIEGSVRFIKKCSDNGIVVAIGHTNSSSQQIKNAVDNGARISTHLGNGCANFIHRHNNPIWPQLDNVLLTPSIIADGHHLLPEEIRVFCKVKGLQNIILTSDLVHLSGRAPGRYSFLGSEVILTEDGMLLDPVLNSLAGASFPLRTGVENIMLFTGCRLEDAINMASGNVSGIYGMNDRGNLNPGKRADIIMFEKSGNKILINRTYVKGKLVYQAEN